MMESLRILVVEDETITAAYICDELIQLGVNPLKPVISGSDAFHAAIKQKPDCILMDIQLAGDMDGVETTMKIHERIKIPVVFMSGYSTELIVEKTRSVDFMALLEKPVTTPQLESIIRQLKTSV